MKLSITSFRCIPAAEIEIAPITLLMGVNGAGKTSIIQALAALTAGVNPLPELTKTRSKELIADGATAALITLETPDGTTTIKYPAGTRSTDGSPFEISEIAAGYTGFIRDKNGDLQKTPTQVKMINELMRSEPTRDDLNSALIGLPAESIQRLWNTIISQGWDAGHGIAKEKGVELKGQWKMITGYTGNYGAQVAESWLPDGWTEDLRTTDVAALTQALAESQAWLETAISESAVSEVEVSRLRTAAGLLPALREQAEDLQIKYDALRKQENSIRAKIKPVESSAPCPYCKNIVIIRGISLIKTDDVPAAGFVVDYSKDLQEIQKNISTANQSLGAKKQQIFDCERSQEQLKKLEAAPKGTGKDVNECRTQVTAATNRLQAFTKYRQALAKHNGIQMNQRIIDILAPDGLRMSRLQDALEKLNGTVQEICGIARWEPVKILPDMSITYGGRAYILSSHAQQFRCKVALQAAWVRLQKEKMVLVDVTSDLDTVSKKGIIRIVAGLQIYGVVAMAGAERSDMFVKDSETRKSYWIEGGAVV